MMKTPMPPQELLEADAIASLTVDELEDEFPELEPAYFSAPPEPEPAALGTTPAAPKEER
jgi:hypothetical protein